jgi:hypothetical protein
VLIAPINVLFLLIALMLIINAFVPGWRASPARWSFAFTLNALIWLLVQLIVLAIVYYLVMLVIGAFISGAASRPLGGAAATLPLMFSGMRRADEPDPGGEPGGPPGLPYIASWWIGFLLTVALAAITLIEAAFTAGQGATLGMDTHALAWLSIAGGVLGVVGRFFPNVQHTVGARYKEFSRAVQRKVVPKDLHWSIRP